MTIEYPALSQDINNMLQIARRLVRVNGAPSVAADRSGIVGQAYAVANWEFLRRSGVGDTSPDYCNCPTPAEQCCYIDPYHNSIGGMCERCRGMTALPVAMNAA